MTRVWLVRHGATTAPVGVAIGSNDPPLSETGREQAGRLAAELAGRDLARIMSSDLQRARVTADAIALPHSLRVETSRALREIDFGAWEGRALGDLWSDDPEAARAWELDIRSTPPSFGESLPTMERRIREFWQANPPPVADREVAVVAHRGSLAVLLSVITKSSLEEAFATTFELGGATCVEVPCR
ncbi:MAG: histidine phosphatase family protein [Candidatus Dormibacteria bacterium]